MKKYRYLIKESNQIVTTVNGKDTLHCHHFYCGGNDCYYCPWDKYDGWQSVRKLIKDGIIECLEE